MMIEALLGRSAKSGGLSVHLLVSCLCLSLAGCEYRTPKEYHIPDGFNGWISVHYEVDGSAPLETRWGRTIIEVDASGRVETSSKPEFGWNLSGDSYYYYRSGQRVAKLTSYVEILLGKARPDASPMAWASGDQITEESIDTGVYKHMETLFVGSEAQRRRLLRWGIHGIGPLDPSLAQEAGEPVRPDRYLIPEGFEGWVEVRHEVPGAEPAVMEDGFLVIGIPEDGRATTSSIGDSDWADNEFYYVGKAGERKRLIDSRSPTRAWPCFLCARKEPLVWESAQSADARSSLFFVGPQEEYGRASDRTLRWLNDDPSYGSPGRRPRSIVP